MSSDWNQVAVLIFFTVRSKIRYFCLLDIGGFDFMGFILRIKCLCKRFLDGDLITSMDPLYTSQFILIKFKWKRLVLNLFLGEHICIG